MQPAGRGAASGKIDCFHCALKSVRPRAKAERIIGGCQRSFDIRCKRVEVVAEAQLPAAIPLRLPPIEISDYFVGGHRDGHRPVDPKAATDISGVSLDLYSLPRHGISQLADTK